MNTLIKLEEAALFALGIFLFSFLDYAWWWFLVLILAPDLSMVGYLLGNKTGAWVYNFFHHRGVALLVYFAGFHLNNQALQLAGIILFAHSSMDKMFGYGLKYENGFKFTHLGEIGKDKTLDDK
jgi:hypothetical protein